MKVGKFFAVGTVVKRDVGAYFRRFNAIAAHCASAVLARRIAALLNKDGTRPRRRR